MSNTKKSLHWGYSTGACAAAVAVAAWRSLETGIRPTRVRLRFLDGKERELPLIRTKKGQMAAIRKHAGDDPDSTDGAVIYSHVRACDLSEARAEDYQLSVGGGHVILRGAEGVGLCTRSGLDCEQGHWAINKEPRRMIAENLASAGLNQGCWLVEIGVENGEELARHTLNPQLGIINGVSLLGTTGLVRPYSHEAYIATVRICVKSHHLCGGTTMVFCTGGRTKAGAEARLSPLPKTAFACIGDFIAASLAAACRWNMKEIIVACMAGKLCKYAAGFENTHAHKVSQDMELLCAEVRRYLPAETDLHTALEHSVSVREALCSIPKQSRSGLLRRLAHTALEQFARRCRKTSPALRLLVFDFDGSFLFEEYRDPTTAVPDLPDLTQQEHSGQNDDSPVDIPLADPVEIVDENYFMRTAQGRIHVLSCGVNFPADPESLTLLKEADTVYGSRSLLEACPIPLGDARVIGAQAREDALTALELSRKGKKVVALASGDALYHGFGGTLSSLAETADDIVYHPGVTAFQALFHRLGLPWQGVRLFCAHAEDLPARAIIEAPLSVTYGGSRHPADAIARTLLDIHPPSAGRAAVIAECLGTAKENILYGPLESLARSSCGPTSLLVLFPTGRLAPSVSSAYRPDEKQGGKTAAVEEKEGDEEDLPVPAPVLALGLPEDDYERENNLITASEVRAVILSRLRLPAWGVLWDMGAGSGSVGLEAAALRPDLEVWAVERKAERGAIIERNRRRMGVINHHLHIGDALTAPPFLPRPDRIFIGGGGKDLPALLSLCLEHLRPGGLMVVSSVTLESLAVLLSWSPSLRVGHCRLDIANEQVIAITGHALKPQHTIHVLSFRKEADTFFPQSEGIRQ